MIFYHILLNIVLKGLPPLINFVTIPIVLNILGEDHLAIILFVALLQVTFNVIDFGIGSFVQTRIAKLKFSEIKTRKNLIGTFECLFYLITAFTTILLVIFSEQIKPFSPIIDLGSYSSGYLFILIIFCVSLQFPITFYNAVLMGENKQTVANLITLLSGLVRPSVILLSITIFKNKDLEQIFLYCLMIHLVVLILVKIYFIINYRARLIGNFKLNLVSDNIKFLSTLTINSLLGLCIVQFDKYFVLLNFDNYSYTRYSLAFTLASLVWLIIQPLNAALYPYISKETTTGSSRNYEALRKYQSVFISITLTFSSFLYFYADQVVRLWVDIADPELVINSLKFLVIGIQLNACSACMIQYSYAKERPQYLMQTNVLQVFVFPGVLIVFTQLFGLLGVALSWCFLNGLYIGITVPVILRKYFDIKYVHWLLKDILGPGILVLILMSTFVKNIPEMHLIFQIGIYFPITLLISLFLYRVDKGVFKNHVFS